MSKTTRDLTAVPSFLVNIHEQVDHQVLLKLADKRCC